MKPSEDARSISISVLTVKQPIGDFYIGVLDARILCEITDFDVRRLIRERDFERYLGIQRPLDKSRVKEIREYVNTTDASFPTGVILSVRGDCAAYNDGQKILTLSNFIDPENPERNVYYRQIAKVIDGQHRIEGLKGATNMPFEVNVVVFVDIDVAEEAYIFSTVNLAQTKVNRSLALDLYDLATKKSPQKFCHNTAVALDQNEKSALYHRIKRLGVATEGRFNETITQANFVDSLMRYISRDPMRDRDIYLNNGIPPKAATEESRDLIFRNMLIDNRDLEIVDILWNYFDAVRSRWGEAWHSTRRGDMLNRSNGFRALMRFLKPCYLASVKRVGEVPSRDRFVEIFRGIDLEDGAFNTKTYEPGSSGEGALFRDLVRLSHL
jgi:DGQHR domain-containing protein